MKTKILGARAFIRFWCLSDYWNYYFVIAWVPTRYIMGTRAYSGLLWCRECISSASTPSPSAKCSLQSVAEFSCIQCHVQDNKNGLSSNYS